jgi:hypothetical protein
LSRKKLWANIRYHTALEWLELRILPPPLIPLKSAKSTLSRSFSILLVTYEMFNPWAQKNLSHETGTCDRRVNYRPSTKSAPPSGEAPT